MLEFADQYEAFRRRDPAWDGVVFVAVKTTAIYCRPVGRVLNVGRRIGTTEGRVVDSQDRLLAHGTTTCLIFPG
jgi:acyl-coenzyme A thioesterase PaaI-like protein